MGSESSLSPLTVLWKEGQDCHWFIATKTWALSFAPSITSAELGHRCLGNQGSEAGRFNPVHRMASPVLCTGGQWESEARWPLGSERVPVPVGSSAECREEVILTTERHWRKLVGISYKCPLQRVPPRWPGSLAPWALPAGLWWGAGERGFYWNTCESLLGVFLSLTPIKSAGQAPWKNPGEELCYICCTVLYWDISLGTLDHSRTPRIPAHKHRSFYLLKTFVTAFSKASDIFRLKSHILNIHF